MPSNHQKDITLLVGECRPKSPEAFRDAISIARQLKNCHYSIEILADAALFHQLSEGRADLVLLGAHSVFRNPTTGEFKYFVNTCGSDAIVELADARNIPVKVVFESMKLQAYENEQDLANVSFEEEEYIAAEATKELGRDELLADRVTIHNIGYDLVTWRKCVSAVMEL
jgi:translation initiation factor 2B subunit (eIF-2B alpha/beta/delta family)